MENTKKDTFLPQHQDSQPGKEWEMNPLPQFDDSKYKCSGKLLDKVAIISGGDSGIGRAVAVAYAKEGADVAIIHLNEDNDAKITEDAIKKLGRKCIVIKADIKQEQESASITEKVMETMGKVDVLVNNAAVQYPQGNILDITKEQLFHTFESNIFSFFYLTKSVLPHMKQGSCIINTASITAFEGHPTLIDYSATKGAIVSFTRSLSLSLANQGIRVNAVAPGPVWTPLIVSSFSAEEIKTFGSTTPMGRAGQPCELAPVYVFLANDDASYISGQIFHINGGMIIN